MPVASNIAFASASVTLPKRSFNALLGLFRAALTNFLMLAGVILNTGASASI